MKLKDRLIGIAVLWTGIALFILGVQSWHNVIAWTVGTVLIVLSEELFIRVGKKEGRE